MPHFPKPWFRKSRGVWYVQIEGVQHNLGADRDQAFARYHELMRRPSEEKKVESDSVVAMIDLFLEWTNNHRAADTFDWYKKRLQSFAESLSVAVRVDQLRPFHVQQWLDGHASWSPGTKRGCVIAVQRAFNWAAKLGYIDRSPVANIEKPSPGKRDTVISGEEFRALLRHVKDDEFRDLLCISWETGCRPQESLRVEARHVDLTNARWVFPPQEAKVKKSPRIVYLPDEALAITKRLMLKYPEGRLLRNTDGRPWHPFAVNCRFTRLAEKVGTKYCLYAFRHSFATRLLESGVDALTVSMLLGHSNVAMLANTYQHLSHNPGFLREAAKKAAS